MDQQDHPDPFAGLEEWARKTERRVRRETRMHGLRLMRMRVRDSGRTARYVRLLLAFAVAGVLLAAAIPVLRSWMPPRTPVAYPTQAVPRDDTVTTLRDAAPTDPFEGTPAAAYPMAEAGITLPKAAAVAGFTRGEVDAALRKIRAALVATRLDHGMLVGHEPGPFLAMLAPSRRAGIRQWFSSGKFSTLATWVYPAATLDPAAPPRVSGRVTYASQSVGRVRTLQVTTNFVWVYAFQGTDQPIAAAHDEIRWDFPDPAGLAPADRGLRIGATKGYLAWVDCDAAAAGMLAPTSRHDLTAAQAPNRGEDIISYLRADHPLEIPDDCP